VAAAAASAPGEGPFLSRTAQNTLKDSELCVRARLLSRVPATRGAFEVARFQLLEILAGPETPLSEVRVLSGASDYFADLSGEALLFLRRSPPGDSFQATGKIVLSNDLGRQKCEFLRGLYRAEREPRGNPRVRAVVAFFVSRLASAIEWERDVAVEELAVLSALRPCPLAPADEAELRAALARPLSRKSASAGRAALAALERDPARAERAIADVRARLGAGRPRDERRQALAQASTVADPRVVALLVNVLDDPDPDLRGEAAIQLGDRGAVIAAPRLLQRLDEEKDPAPLGKVVDALGVLRYLPATPGLKGLVERPGLGARAVLALRRIGGDEALEALQELRRQAPAREGRDPELERALGFVFSPDFEVQERALEKLRKERH
jgi:hypothetical protein